MNDLIGAISRLYRLKQKLPRTGYDVVLELKAVSDIVPEEFPNKDELIDLIDSIEKRGKPDDAINIMSDDAQKIHELCIGLEIFSKFQELRDALFKFEDRMSQIANVFPPNHFDFRGIVMDLNKNILPQTAVTRLTESITYFNEGKFENAIEESAKASELLTDEFVKFIGENPEENWWPNLQKLYSKLNSSTSTSDLRWYIWSLFNLHHKMRVVHDTETQKIDEWMDKHRKHMRTTPEWARISVICALQGAKEFQELIKRHL